MVFGIILKCICTQQYCFTCEKDKFQLSIAPTFREKYSSSSELMHLKIPQITRSGLRNHKKLKEPGGINFSVVFFSDQLIKVVFSLL